MPTVGRGFCRGRPLGRQSFAAPRTWQITTDASWDWQLNSAKLVSYCVGWPPPERKAPETHVEVSTALIPGRPHWPCYTQLGPIAGAPQGPGRAVAPVQTIPTASFRATNYEVRASLDAVGQVMNAQAKVDFAAREAGRVVDVELNQNLRVNSVRDVSGKPVTYDRDDSADMKLHVTLAETIPVGGKVTLFFDYGGPLSSRMNSPDQAMRMSYIAQRRRIPAASRALVSADGFSLESIYRNFPDRSAREHDGGGHGTSAGPPASVTPKVLTSSAPMLGNSRSSAPVIAIECSSASVDGK